MPSPKRPKPPKPRFPVPPPGRDHGDRRKEDDRRKCRKPVKPPEYEKRES